MSTDKAIGIGAPRVSLAARGVISACTISAPFQKLPLRRPCPSQSAIPRATQTLARPTRASVCGRTTGGLRRWPHRTRKHCKPAASTNPALKPVAASRGRVEIIATDQGNRTTPSYVAFTDTERLIGDAAKNQVPFATRRAASTVARFPRPRCRRLHCPQPHSADPIPCATRLPQTAMNPTNTVFDAKRLIGRKFSDTSIQDDLKNWSFKVKSGPAEKPIIEVTFKGEVKTFSAEEISSMVLVKMCAAAANPRGLNPERPSSCRV